MSGFVTPSGERFTIFGEGGGQLLADDLDVPLLGKIPLQEELRIGADEGRPLVLTDPDAPASQALFHTARGLMAMSPRELPQPPEPEPAAPSLGTALPMAPAGAKPDAAGRHAATDGLERSGAAATFSPTASSPERTRSSSASTTRGSNWVPAPFSSSAIATSSGSAAR